MLRIAELKCILGVDLNAWRCRGRCESRIAMFPHFWRWQRFCSSHSKVFQGTDFVIPS
ncbi:hypothetical protein M758_4G223900 [Ceratodon purpureus]|nr:hypothetical protein M758_4G223900 [Ceratodon purpureus]